MFGCLQFSHQLLFGLFNVLVHLLSLLFLHLMKSFPARRVFKLKRAGLSEMWKLLTFPGRGRKKDTYNSKVQKSTRQYKRQRAGWRSKCSENTYLWYFGIFCSTFSGSPSSSSKCSVGSTMAGHGVLKKEKTT